MIAAGPTPLWYAARSSGYVSLLLLTAIIGLGLATSVRWSSRGWPRFLSQALHRNLSLLALVFLFVHVATSVVDPFAGISAVNAMAPFTGTYRPIWLGLGVVALELMLALTVTSLLRHRIGFRTWRVVHWAAYACWPAAVLHTLGTGSDVRSAWAVLITLACMGGVLAAIAWRLVAKRVWLPLRTLGMAATLGATISVVGFALAGPLHNGWARSAGTPPQLLAAAGQPSAATPTAAPAPPGLPANLTDAVSGSVSQQGASVEADLVDARDRGLRIVLVSPNGGGGATLQMTITENGARLCSTGAVVGRSITATCGATAVSLTITQQADGSLSGRLQTGGPG